VWRLVPIGFGRGPSCGCMLTSEDEMVLIQSYLLVDSVYFSFCGDTIER
jgi:hypothetical protein